MLRVFILNCNLSIRLLQLLNEEVANRLEQVQARVAAKDAMIAIGVHLLAEHFALLYISLTYLGKVAEVNVIVGCSVNKEQVTVKVLCTLNGVDVITVSVLFRCTHIAFGIYRVVILPIT